MNLGSVPCSRRKRYARVSLRFSGRLSGAPDKHGEARWSNDPDRGRLSSRGCRRLGWGRPPFRSSTLRAQGNLRSQVRYPSSYFMSGLVLWVGERYQGSTPGEGATTRSTEAANRMVRGKVFVHRHQPKHDSGPSANLYYPPEHLFDRVLLCCVLTWLVVFFTCILRGYSYHHLRYPVLVLLSLAQFLLKTNRVNSGLKDVLNNPRKVMWRLTGTMDR